MLSKEPIYPLVFSSFLFLLPGTYALLYKHSLFSFITYSISLASMNHWLEPNNENKLFYDKYISYTGCFLYIVNTLYYIPKLQIKFTAISCVFSYYLFYKLSCFLFKNNNDKWIYAHFIFHLLVNTSKWILYMNI